MTRAAELSAFVAALPSTQLHGLAGKLRREAEAKDWSSGQEYLWNLCVLELEHRRRSEANPLHRCSCELCFSPFEEPELPF
jgi:hypothetical protein